MPRKSAPIQVHQRYTNLRLVVLWSRSEDLTWAIIAHTVDGPYARDRRIAQGTVRSPAPDPSPQLAVRLLRMAAEAAEAQVTGSPLPGR